MVRVFFTNSELIDHRQSHVFKSSNFKIIKEVFNGASRIFRLEKLEDNLELVLSDDVKKEIYKIILSECSIKKRCLFSAASHCAFVKFDEDGEIESRINIVFQARRAEVNIFMDNQYINSIFDGQISEILKRIEDFTENGSGWTLSEVYFFDLSFVSISSVRGGCNMNFDKINNCTKRGLLNIKNDDDFCLLYCIIAKFHSKSIPLSERSNPHSYNVFFHEFNLKGINFPISTGDISLLEKNNSHLNFKINVFIEMDKEVFPIRMYDVDKNELAPKKIVNVLLKECLTNDNKHLFHYILIEDVDKFFSTVYISPSGKKSYAKTHTCSRCIARFSSEEKMKQHTEVCKNPGEILKPIRTFKKPGEKLAFEKPWLKYPHFYTGFVDFESNLIKNNSTEKSCVNCIEKKIKCEHSYTDCLSNHVAVNYCFIIVDRDCNVVYEKVYTGDDAVTNFINTICDLEVELRYSCSLNKNMIFTTEDKKLFDEAKNCHICKRYIKCSKDKVRDHCHATGRFIGAAHNICNLNRKEKPIMKIFAHNFSGYDSHLIIEKLDNASVKNISVIPKSGEKFMAVEINNTFTLCDSMSFLTGSLDSLSASLGASHEYLLIRQSSLLQKNKGEEFFKLVMKKWKYRK